MFIFMLPIISLFYLPHNLHVLVVILSALHLC
uniref:Uncharacterized protein n=1 Tax=Anguilla anguilla TaxID=7936 RepID=A0A0E9Y2C7_ANGAN